MATASKGPDSFTQDDALITVTMDVGVYRWLNEIIEAKQRDRSYGWIDWYRKLVDRATEQFRAAGEPPVESSDDSHKRVIRRRVAKDKAKG
jgi:hypothetical protein